MFYVQRDKNGKLLRVEREPFEGMNDKLASTDHELDTWMRNRDEMIAQLEMLKRSDLDMLRIMEDVVNVLVERGLIRYTDLPVAARAKLDERALARAEIEGLSDHPLDEPDP